MSSPSPSNDTAQDITLSPSRAPRPGGGGWATLMLAVPVLLFAAVIAVYTMFGHTIRTALLDAACDLSDCAGGGMAATGWALVAAPVLTGVALRMFWRRLRRTGRRVLGTATAFSLALFLLFMPGRRRVLSDLVTGLGHEQVMDGMAWAAGGLAVGLVLLAALALAHAFAPDQRAITVAFAAAVPAALLGALPIAVVGADPVWPPPDDLLPQVLMMNGDTLTRDSVRQQADCDGVLADDSLLNIRNCYLTMQAEYTTNDSDARVTLRAVRYRDPAAANEIHAALPSRQVPVGATGDVITTVSTTHAWVLIGTAGHADGRPIADADRRWVRWPLAQVTKHFVGTQGGHLTDPDPTADAGPRTP